METQKDKTLEHKVIFELDILNLYGTNEHFSFIHVVTLFFHQWDNFSAPLIIAHIPLIHPDKGLMFEKSQCFLGKS